MNMHKMSLEDLAFIVIKVIGVSIFGLMSLYAFRYTHYMVPREVERTEILQDSMGGNLAAILILGCILIGLEFCDRKMSERSKNIISGGAIILCMVWIAAAGFWWITIVDRIPEGDQAFLYGGASYFIEGMYSFLNPKGGYFGIYPYQLPLVSLMEALFRIVGPLNYYAYQVLNVFFTVGIVFLGYLFVREVSKSLTSSLIYVIFMAGCFPLFFYTNWVYGEIPCLSFSFLAAWTLMKYAKTEKLRWLVGVVFGLTMAMVTRKNATILVVAFCLVSLVYMIYKKKPALLIAMAAVIICPILIYKGVATMYEVRSGYECSEGMPSSLFVELGLHESSGRYGWDDMSALELSASVGYDWEKADAIAKERIRNDLERFKEDKAYAKLFFREKVLSQWNNPLFQSLYFSANYRDENLPPQDTFVYKISHDYFMDILKFSNYVQLVVFIGVAFYYLFAVKRGSNILQHFFAVGLIGGFLFCIIWEAKGRYMFPYYISMFPLAVIGFNSMMEYVKNSVNMKVLKSSRKDNF